MSIDGTPITLWCLEYGSSYFSVIIRNNNSIFDLKKAIFEEISVPDNVKAKNLSLWSVNVEEIHLKSNTPDGLMTNKNEIKLATQKVGNTFHGVQGNNIQVIVRVPVATSDDLTQLHLSGFFVAKRSYDEMQIDRTGIICNALIQPFSSVPSRAGDLTSLINALLTWKLSVSFYEEIKFPQLADFIETKNDECERMDSIIRIPLQIFHENLGRGILPIEMDRNSKDGNKRPDFLCWTNNVLLLKGEEKAVIEDFSKAKNKLEEKFNKFDYMYFGNIQFMICYAAAETRLCFFAIDGSPNTNLSSRLVVLSNQLDVNNRQDRVSILCIVVNIARIIRTVGNTIPEMIVPLGKWLVSVEYLLFVGNLDDCINFLSEMYEYAKGHPGLVQVKEGSSISHVCQLRNEDEARAMSQSVLTGLNWLHKGGYIYCDIRLPNILFIPGDADCKYVLIDFKHANVDGLHNEYKKKSDLYQFGKMLRDLNMVNSEAGKKFLDGLRDKSINIKNVLRYEWFR
ncbi:3686_t:CDS:2 [Racocetra fulgida]|uniref:3686_t:CDS:1 n=2 Tax=Glomeromycetes TaxID=214506 RepID=A0A9N9B4H8_9GLOM|nr:3686_t:CDS:2 [Racocetra fulgida]